MRINRFVRVSLGLLASVALTQAASAESAARRTYAVPYDQAWVAVTRAAHGMPQWIIVAASEESGLVTARKSSHAINLPKPKVRIVVERTSPTTTSVAMQRVAGEPLEFLTWWADGGEFRQFFKELDELLPTSDGTP